MALKRRRELGQAARANETSFHGHRGTASSLRIDLLPGLAGLRMFPWPALLSLAAIRRGRVGNSPRAARRRRVSGRASCGYRRLIAPAGVEHVAGIRRRGMAAARALRQLGAGLATVRSGIDAIAGSARLRSLTGRALRCDGRSVAAARIEHVPGIWRRGMAAARALCQLRARLAASRLRIDAFTGRAWLRVFAGWAGGRLNASTRAALAERRAHGCARQAIGAGSGRRAL